MKDKSSAFKKLTFIVLIVFALAAAVVFKLLDGLSLQKIKTAIDSFGGMAPLIFMLLCILRGLVFIPCGLLSTLGGMLFGPLTGTVFTLFGFTAGSVITFYLARGFGKGWAQRTLGNKYDKYDGYISKDSFCSVFLMRVVPILPFDVVSCIAGMSRTRLDKYILATLIGSLPGVFIYVFFGDSVKSMSIRRLGFSAIFIVVFATIPFCYKHFIKLIQKNA